MMGRLSSLGKPAVILLVEDDTVDADLTRMALRSSKHSSLLKIVTDGECAMNYLRKQGEFEDAPTPDFVLLDLNLPRKNGKEVLAEIRQDPQLHLMVVVVLTTSSSEKDVRESYALRANTYVTKPADLDSFLRVVQDIESFWVSSATLPTAIPAGLP
jgi:two-component system, chemotaxis family, response regulator Rcp1